MAVDKLVDSTQLDSDLTSVANAIRTKGGTSASLAFPSDFVTAIGAIPTGITPIGTKQISISSNGTTTEDVTTYASAEITVNVPAGGGYVEEKGVNFYDYDGTLVASYTAVEFAALNAMPSNPSHTGLTAQGWNWSLSDAKTYVAAYGFLDIGQMYVTSDGKTRIYITLGSGRLSPYLGVCVNGSLDVDWGDGSTHSTLTGTSLTTTVWQQHTYSTDGDYVIALTPSSGSTFSFYAGSYSSRILRKTNASSATNEDYVYISAITKVELGTGMSTLKQSSFRTCHGIQTVTIPNSVTSFESDIFNGCSSLSHINIPSWTSSVSMPASAFSSCYSLRHISLPLNIGTIGNSFLAFCRALEHVTIPSNVTSIGTDLLNDLYEMTWSYAIIPNSVTSIGASTFSYSKGLSKVFLSSNITSIPNSAFTKSNIVAVAIPSKVTSIGSSAFNTCRNLSSITIPDKVTSIAASAFNNCAGLASIKFEGTTPPTVANSNAWTGLSSDCKIYVPSGYLSAYTSASNYPSSGTYTYVEY